MRREDGESGVRGVATVGGKDSAGRDGLGEKVTGIVVAVKQIYGQYLRTRGS